MKKLFGFFLVFIMTQALANELPKRVDIYRAVAPSSKEMVGIPLLGLLGSGLSLWAYNIKKAHNGWSENATILGLCGVVTTLAPILYVCKRLYDYRSRHMPVLSLRPDGLWYKQKFICKWQEVDGMTHVLDPNASIRLLHIYDRSGIVMIVIWLDELNCTYDDLMDGFNSFIATSKNILRAYPKIPPILKSLKEQAI